jgi:hypothetical protein
MPTRLRALALSATLALAPLPPALAARPATPAAPQDVTVTESDVRASNAKVYTAYRALVQMWSTTFRQLDARFAAPDLVRYRGAVRNACGVLRGGNAGYCPGDNRIYFDEVFVAAQARRAAAELGTDGDMAAIGVIAHEMGHAVAIQLGHVSRVTYENEATADCLAGAFARQAEKDGSLEAGDLDEAFYGMATAADPTPELTGDPRVDRRVLFRAARSAHGTGAQRMGNFRAGYDGGPRACLADLRARS